MFKKLARFSLYWVPVMAYGALIFYFSSQSAPDFLPSFEYSDKYYHTVIYVIMGILWCWALQAYAILRAKGRYWALVIVFTILFGISDEIHQSFVAGREADFFDVVFDSLGALLAPPLYILMTRIFPVLLKLS